MTTRVPVVILSYVTTTVQQHQTDPVVALAVPIQIFQLNVLLIVHVNANQPETAVLIRKIQTEMDMVMYVIIVLITATMTSGMRMVMGLEMYVIQTQVAGHVLDHSVRRSVRVKRI